MTATLLADVSNQVQKIWSPIFTDDLMESTVLPSLVNRDYEGELAKGGDTVYVSQINRPTAQRKTVGTSGYDSFTAGKLSTSRIAIVADQIITAAYEFDDLVQLQSQIGDQDSKVRKGLLEAADIEVTKMIYEAVSPSTATPDHVRNGITDFNAAEVLIHRKLASQAKWPDMDRYLLLDPSYFNDFLGAATMTSADYVPDAPVVGGKTAVKRFGFWVLEDNASGMSQISPTAQTEDLALSFHKDFCHMVLSEPVFEVSSLHANKQHGYLISVKYIAGVALGIDGDVKHIVSYNT